MLMLFFMCSVFVFSIVFTKVISAVTDPGTIAGITIGDTNLTCGEEDDICPSDYANCSSCVIGSAVDDPDCCTDNACGWGCTNAGVVCGDSDDEIWSDETDSEGDTVSDSSAEDCSGNCTAGTENVIDDENNPACVDTYYNGTVNSYDASENCAEDGIVFMPYSQTSNICAEERSCRDTDDDGDREVCDGGNWHDPDESETYCTAAEGVWTTGTGTDTFKDDYDGNLSNGYCDGDDGYKVTGAIVAETYRGSSYCEAADGVIVSIKNITNTSRVYDTATTASSSSWSETTTCHQDSADNSVGSYTVTLEPGKYYLVAEKEGYNTVTQTIDLSSMSSDQEHSYFWMYYNDECQSDCTKNDKICYAACEGVNGCNYSSYAGTSIADYCDGLQKGYRYVLTEEIDAASNSIYGSEVYCCNTEPQEYVRDYFTSDDAETNCVENIISREKGFFLTGEWAIFHFVLFSEPHPEKSDACKSLYANFACEVYGEAFC